MTREEAQSFIDNKKICAAQHCLEVNAKLNEIYNSEHEVVDFPYVYIIKGVPTWGASPRKYSKTQMEEIPVEEFLNITLEEPQKPDTLLSDLYPIGTVIVNEAKTHYGYVGAEETVVAILREDGELVQGWWHISEFGDTDLADMEDVENFYELLAVNGYVVDDTDAENHAIVRIVEPFDKYYFIGIDRKSKILYVGSKVFVGSDTDRERLVNGNCFATKASANAALKIMTLLFSE